MVIMILESVSPSLRGQLTRWLIEPKAGVFVGTLSAMVRDKLWEKVCQATKEGGAILIHSARNEQGFSVRFWSNTSRWITDWEGLQLVTRPNKQ
ncbi:MAG TPA: type I-E CRISPR-associated endoribonuclease Cas2e [Candidatus Hydrogenedentes bacterium]|nr:type I-E CRISPR-associated endoribonuclease Cas2e [Candidatus Hydrogenedentota bacterium]HPG65207.1 type I-E CRISPR-associated endoribonuclease Cas2e [Candidatus Hydrogenedentota bacterium]